MTQKLKNTIKLMIWNDLHVTSLCYNSILHYSLLASSFLRGECKSFNLLLKSIELKRFLAYTCQIIFSESNICKYLQMSQWGEIIKCSKWNGRQVVPMERPVNKIHVHL